VTDQTGSLVPAAKLVVVNPSTNFTRSGVTDNQGACSFQALPAGEHTVTVSATGFQESTTTTGVPVTINTVLRLDATLQLGKVQESVSVTAVASPLLQTQRAEVRSEIGRKSLQSLPGLALGRPPNNSASNPSQSYSVDVNGAGASLNNARVDGASSMRRARGVSRSRCPA
jgi:hypothetical protein